MATHPAPKTRDLRAEQLRAGKRRQRARERAAGLTHIQLTLPDQIAKKLAVAARLGEFPKELEGLLDHVVIRPRDYPMLADIAWNLHEEYIPARNALALYERNWRFVDLERMQARERALLHDLAERFGSGLIHA